jgi:pSer/pThr/pTyr-binding forkhead associated (FHA) protein
MPAGGANQSPPPRETTPCPRCAADNPSAMRFCRMCGGSLTGDAVPAAGPAPAAPPPRGPRCRAVVDRGAAFCGVCGLSATDMFPVVAPPANVKAQVAAQPVAPPSAMPIVVAPAASGRAELRPEGPSVGESGAGPCLVTILKDGSEGTRYPLHESITDIGRSEGAIVLPDDPYLSARHARIALRGGRYALRDLGSVNGIFYRLREPHTLQHGDLLLVGQQVLRFELLAESEASAGPAMHYGVMLFGTPEQPRLARLVQLTTEGIPRDVFHLYREETVLGRESADIVVADDAFLSRRHVAFKLERAERRVTVRDLGSSNGTLVQFRGEREIADGDLFRIGHHLFRFDQPRGAAGPHGGPPGR